MEKQPRSSLFPKESAFEQEAKRMEKMVVGKIEQLTQDPGFEKQVQQNIARLEKSFAEARTAAVREATAQLSSLLDQIESALLRKDILSALSLVREAQDYTHYM